MNVEGSGRVLVWPASKPFRGRTQENRNKKKKNLSGQPAPRATAEYGNSQIQLNRKVLWGCLDLENKCIHNSGDKTQKTMEQ